MLDRNRDVTASWLDDLHPGDGGAWMELCAQWDRIGRSLIGGLLTPFPPVKAALGGLVRLPRAGGLQLVRDLLTPAADLGRHRFGGEAPRILLAGNAGHSDIPLDAPGSGLMGAADEHARPDGRLPGARRAVPATSPRPWRAGSPHWVARSAAPRPSTTSA